MPKKTEYAEGTPDWVDLQTTDQSADGLDRGDVAISDRGDRLEDVPEGGRELVVLLTVEGPDDEPAQEHHQDVGGHDQVDRVAR